MTLQGTSMVSMVHSREGIVVDTDEAFYEDVARANKRDLLFD